nr:GntR family transcriptional regulator [Puniceicoccus vermicola]
MTTGSKVRQSRSEFVFKRLEQRILSWKYLPGHHLKEDEICTEFNVSRIPVREALGRLSQIHLVERKPNMGCTVKRWTVDELTEFYELRLALESYVVETLAREGPPEGAFDSLQEAWRKHRDFPEECVVSGLDWSRRDEKFHIGICEVLGNQQILSTLQDINARLRFLRVKDINSPERIRISSNQHLAILKAILSGDAETAKRTLRKNIYTGKSNVESSLRDILIEAYSM